MGILFGILTIFFPVPCLLYLGYGRAQFTAPSFQIRQWPKIVQILLNGTVFLFSAAEFLVLVFVVGLLSIRENTPRPVVEYLIKDNNEKIGNVTQQGDVVRRADMMDAAAIETAQSQRSGLFLSRSLRGQKCGRHGVCDRHGPGVQEGPCLGQY